jgi:transposase InsO family protein
MQKKPCIEIYSISGAAFHLLSKRKSEDEIFAVTLHEVEALIQERHAERQRVVAISTLTVELAEGRQTAQQFAARVNELNVEPLVPPEYAEWAHVFSKAESDILPPHRSYDHKIELAEGGEQHLRYSPLYKMSAEELEVVKEYITENLSKGFIEPSQAPFAAPVLFVKKPNGSLRFCIDFRVLNSLTRKDRYPLPLIDETLARIANARIFTKLDIRQAFHRIRMDPASEEYTTFRTRYGAYKCKVLPFGLTNGPATYQRYMNDVLFDYLDDFCTAYLDDILIYSEDPLKHQDHVKKVLQRLQDAGLQVDLKKCEFGVTRTKYLGFIISTSGLEVDPEKVSVVRSWTYPGSVKGVQSFLGFCNFYRRFIKDYGIIAKPLVHLTKNNVPFRFTRECEDAFDHLKHTLTSAPLLRHYQQNLPCLVETDASDGVVAGVLSQQHGEDWFPVAFFSKTMLPAELNYAVHDKEMLAIIRSFGQWRAELAGTAHQIRVVTDHKALEYFMTSKQLNARQARWAELLADYNFMITYRPGAHNPLADALSRKPEELDEQNTAKKAQRLQQLLRQDQVDPALVARNLRPPDDIDNLVTEAEVADLSPAFSVVHQALEANRTAPSLQALRRQAWSDKPGKLSMEGDLLLYDGRLMVPDVAHLRTLLIREVHDNVRTAHPSAKKTLQLLSSQYWWYGITSSVQQYCRNCHTCRRIQVPRDKKPGLLQPLPVPSRPWEHITVDYCSFNKDKHGFDNVLVFIDRFSKQAVSIPCRKTSDARDLAKLYMYHVYRYFGPPLSITSDRGPQFVSRFWNAFCKILGTKRQLSTADHPQTDGQTEVYNQYLQRQLHPFISHYQDDWSEFLPIMDYAQMTLPHDSLGGLSPFEVVHGYAPRVDWDWKTDLPDSATPADKLNTQQAVDYAARQRTAWNAARSSLLEAQAKMARSYNRSRRVVDFDVDDLVWLDMRYFTTTRPSKKLDFPTNGPFRVLEKVGSSYRLELPASMKVHNVFPAARLRKDPNDPLPGQQMEAPPPINITGDDEWEIEDILACRKQRGNLSYRVSWLNHDVDLTWYSASDVKYAPAKIKEFHLNNPTQAGPPAKLPDWLQAFNDGVDDYDHLDGDKEMDGRSRTSFFRRGGSVTRRPLWEATLSRPLWEATLPRSLWEATLSRPQPLYIAPLVPCLLSSSVVDSKRILITFTTSSLTCEAIATTWQ